MSWIPQLCTKSTPVMSAAATDAAQPQHVFASINVPEDFNTISEALLLAEDGDTIYVAPGDYHEFLIINKDVTVTGHRGSHKDIRILSSHNTAFTVRCKGVGKVRNLSIIVDDSSNFYHCLAIESGVVMVENCDMSGGAWGVCVNNGAAAQVSQCRVHDNKGTGVNVYGGATLDLTMSEVCNNKGRGVSVSDNDTEVTMRGNNVHHCSDGIYVYGKAKLTMEENYVHSNQDSGVTVHESGTNAIIKYNTLHANGWGGVRVYSGAGAQVTDNDLQGNQSAALYLDKKSTELVDAQNNQTTKVLPSGLKGPAHSARTALAQVNLTR
mmetsp:Transcript_32357/g.73902  ORF Transcript_32357/g.73902 Transcript_32357/m.73902 type:complete len:324 (+) Transcript_32357:4-975(+)